MLRPPSDRCWTARAALPSFAWCALTATAFAQAPIDEADLPVDETASGSEAYGKVSAR